MSAALSSMSAASLDTGSSESKCGVSPRFPSHCLNERRHLPCSKGVPQSRLAGVLRALRPREVRLLLMPRVVEYPSSERKVRAAGERRERTPRAGSPYIQGVRRSGPHGALGGILACVLDRLIRAVSTRRTTRSCTDRQFWAEPFGFGASGRGSGDGRARSKAKGAPTRPTKANARPTPDQMACFSCPVRNSGCATRCRTRLAHRCLCC